MNKITKDIISTYKKRGYKVRLNIKKNRCFVYKKDSQLYIDLPND